MRSSADLQPKFGELAVATDQLAVNVHIKRGMTNQPWIARQAGRVLLQVGLAR